MDTYFEYKLWADFYAPMIFLIAFISIWLFIGFCRLIEWLKDKWNNKK